jgi:uncharacterized surface protein with fasciclin (FAS1) repeats
MLFRTMRFAAAAAFMAVAAAGCADGTAPGGNSTITAVLASSTSHSTFRGYLSQTGVNATLNNPDIESTVFAPTDAAFAALPANVQTRMNTDAEYRAEVIRNHVVTGELAASALTNGRVLTSNAGNTLTVTLDGAIIEINGVPITLTNVGAANGIIHVTNQVILPPD